MPSDGIQVLDSDDPMRAFDTVADVAHSMPATLSSSMLRSRRDADVPGVEYLCGWGAAFVNILITFPLNKLLFRQQLHGIHVRQAFGQLHAEGIGKLYRGMLPPLLQKTSCLAIMFGTYDGYRRLLADVAMPSAVRDAAAAMLAGSTEAVLLPFERVQTLLQDEKFHGRLRNTLHSMVELRPYGVREYYRGLTAVLARNGPSNVVFFGLREPVKAALPPPDTPAAHVLEDFVSGAVLGAAISTVFYPLNVVKTHMQARLGGDMPGVFATFQIVFAERDRSWRRLLRGVHFNYTRSLISWGIINATYEVLKKWLMGSKAGVRHS